MKQRLLVFGLFAVLCIIPSHSAYSKQTEHDVPYLYYLSWLHNGVVIERADGTDSHVLGQDLLPDNAGYARGGGWSPSGQWIAWLYEVLSDDAPFWPDYPTFLNIVHRDSQETFTRWNDWDNISQADWSPVADQLLVMAHPLLVESRSIYQLEVVDVNSGKVLVERTSDEEAITMSADWSPSGRYVLVWWWDRNAQSYIRTELLDVQSGDVTGRDFEADELARVVWIAGDRPVFTNEEQSTIVDPATGSALEFDADEGTLAVQSDPSGQWITFFAGDDIRFINLIDQSTHSVESGDVVDPSVFSSRFQWSPDGRYAVFVKEQGGLLVVDTQSMDVHDVVLDNAHDMRLMNTPI